MKLEDASLRTVEPFEAIKKHPGAATFGGVFTAVFFGLMGAAGAGGEVAFLMAAVGAMIGAPGGAHIAEAAEPERPV